MWIDETSNLRTAEEGFPSLAPASISGPLPQLLEAQICGFSVGVDDSPGRKEAGSGKTPREESPGQFNAASDSARETGEDR
jgi:hypothetical protein